ncbi:MAG: YicC family protein [Oscillospiraceae bacterium]|nr:YicC family protein [Oscillospiraceae bacterium]
MAIRSMTGFGRDGQIIDGREITVEIRGVNHRYYEFSARMYRQYNYLEDKIKTLIGGKVSRGKVEAGVTVHNIGGKEVEVTLNHDVVSAYLAQLRAAKLDLVLEDTFTIADVLRIPDAFTVSKKEVDEDEIWEAVSTVANNALTRFVAMRETEGAKLAADILGRLDFIERATAQIEAASPQSTERYRAKLSERMKEVLANGADEQRIMLEAAIFAEKTAVDEETVRLRSHVAQVRELLNSEDIVGRKLDFIVQEMNREINTIGSKVHDIAVTRTVVDLKSELEKIREQIQNIE